MKEIVGGVSCSLPMRATTSNADGSDIVVDSTIDGFILIYVGTTVGHIIVDCVRLGKPNPPSYWLLFSAMHLTIISPTILISLISFVLGTVGLFYFKG